MPLPSSEELQTLIKVNKTFTILTGAGVSTDSGLPDFKSIDAAWPFPMSREEATSLHFFNRNRKVFWEAFRYLFTSEAIGVEPNAFHYALASLEDRGKEVTIITQNIDGLHQKSGSSSVVELHGSLQHVICNRQSCSYREPLTDTHDERSRCPVCRKFLRPDVVLFGEKPQHFEHAKSAALLADVLIVAGASLDVGPVNEIPHCRERRHPDKKSLWVNKDAPPPGYTFSHELITPLATFATLITKL